MLVWPSRVSVARSPGSNRTQVWEMDARGRATGNLVTEVANVRDARRLLIEQGYTPDVPGSISNWSKEAMMNQVKAAMLRVAERWAKRVLVRDLGGDLLPEEALFLRRIGPHEAYRAGDWVFLVDPSSKRVLKKQYDKRASLAAEIVPGTQVRVMRVPIYASSQISSFRESTWVVEEMEPGRTPDYVILWFKGKNRAFRGNLDGRGGLSTLTSGGGPTRPVKYEVLNVQVPMRTAAGRSYTVTLFSDTGQVLFEQTFEAMNDRDADQKAVKIVQPHVRRHNDAEDWVVEPA